MSLTVCAHFHVFSCMLISMTYCLLMHIYALCPVTQLSCSDHCKQFSCLARTQAKQKNNFFMIHPFCCSSSLVNKLSLLPLIFFSWQTIALWLTSTLHKGLVQMSQDVYYKGLDLEQVRKARPLALMVCVCLCVLWDRWRRVQEYVYSLLGLHITEAVSSQGNNALILIRS